MSCLFFSNRKLTTSLIFHNQFKPDELSLILVNGFGYTCTLKISFKRTNMEQYRENFKGAK